MTRTFVAAVLLLALAAPVRADRMPPLTSPIERALRMPVVVVGKVASIEKETTEAPLFPGALEKVPHRIALVKIETNLAGAAGITHIRVGFVTPKVPVRRGPENPELAEGQTWLFFLTKYPDATFYSIPYMTPPVDSESRDYKTQLASVKRVMDILDNPAKALKAEKVEDRYLAAVALIYKLRSVPEGIREVETVDLTAAESRPILKALAEDVWVTNDKMPLHGERAFRLLGLGATDGWMLPMPEAGQDYPEQVRAAYAKWLDGPGKDYRIKKIAPKHK
jgi:hypothetical protein